MEVSEKLVLCVLATVCLSACGGGGDDNTASQSVEAVNLPPAPTFNAAPLTTSNEIAKAAAAIIVANTTFERTIDMHLAFLTSFAPTDNSTKEIFCGERVFTTDKIQIYKITTNNHPPYTSYRTIESDRCTGLLGDYGFNRGGGKLIYACNDSGCLATATGLRFDRLKAESLYQTANGIWDSKNDISTFKGNVRLFTNGLSSTFYFNDGLVQNPPNNSTGMGKGSFGKIGVSSGNALNCIDGEITYNVIEPISVFNRVNGGSIKIMSNNIAVGVVTFKSDGSLIVKKDGAAEENITQSTFESFCALKKVYDFSK